MGHIVTLLSSRKIIVSDSFNRPDNAASMGKADTGQTWNPQSDTPGIINNKAYMAVGTGRVFMNTSISDNFAVQVTFDTVTALDNVLRLLFRYIDGSNEMFVGKLSATTYALVKRVGGTLTTLGSIAQEPVNGDVLRVEVRGSNIIAKLNGVPFANVSDSANSTGTGFGFFIGDSVARLDDFLIEGL